MDDERSSLGPPGVTPPAALDTPAAANAYLVRAATTYLHLWLFGGILGAIIACAEWIS